jgi:prepilin-type N-terminal cleavage/methylation domain-containing protein
MNFDSEICHLTSEPKNRRRGWTLVELLVVSAVLTLLLAIVASATHTMYRSQRSTRRDVTSRRILTRLSLQLRQDVHAARQAEVEPSDGDEQAARITLERAPRQTIQYVFHGDRGEIERIVLAGESQAARDTFPLPPNSSATFKVVGEPTSHVVVLTIQQLVVGQPDAGERTLQTQAALGLDGRHESTHRSGGIQE